MSQIETDVQQLTPGPDIELWELNATSIGGGIVRFQGMQDGKIWFQGLDYDAYPCQGEGFEQTGEQQPVPKFRVGNTDRAITILCQLYDDLVGATLTRRRTYAKYLDAVNFVGGNPTADPTQERAELWFIERKSSESFESVEFELSSALDFNGVKLPRRQIIANQCGWQYRDANCNYVGPPGADELDQPTDDPLLDKCGRRLTSCKLHLWPDGVLNFGGQPAADLVRL